MTPQQEKKLIKVGLFSPIDAKKIGLSHQDLSRLMREGSIVRLARGIYLHSKAKISREIDFQVACLKFGPHSAIGGLSALFYYNLIEQVPEETWVLVPSEKRSNEKGFHLIRTKTRLDHGIIQGDGHRIVSVERAIVEGLKLATKIGERTAVRAAREAIKQKLTNLIKIGKMAKELGLETYLTKYFEVIIA